MCQPHSGGGESLAALACFRSACQNLGGANEYRVVMRQVITLSKSFLLTLSMRYDVSCCSTYPTISKRHRTLLAKMYCKMPDKQRSVKIDLY